MSESSNSTPAVSQADIASWHDAIGRTESRTEVLSTEALRRFAIAVGSTPDVEDNPPPLSHWAFFLPEPEDCNLGTDGHERRGGFLPAVSLPRRMFAGSTIEFLASLLLEQEAVETRSIADVNHKSGRSGDLVFVEVDRAIEQDGVIRIRERQSYVYRNDGPKMDLPVPAIDPQEGERWHPVETNLFRFSAATFNSHRIHYDLPYAREVEGYPALVVHGPFTAAKLAAVAARQGRLTRFRFRANAPLFLGQPIYLRAARSETVEAVRCDGKIAMTAEFLRAG